MSIIKKILIVGSFAASGTAMAQGVDVKFGVGIPLSPGLNATSPGQAYNADRTSNPTTALSPGQFFIQNRANDPNPASPPGQGVQNYGKSKK